MNTKTALAGNTRLKVLAKNKNFQNYAYIVFSLIAIIVFAIFAIRPTIKDIAELQKSISDKTTLLHNLQAKYKNLDTAWNNYNAIPDDTKLKLYTLLPDSSNVSCYINYVNDITGQSRANIVGLQFQPFDLKGVSHCNPSTSDLEAFKQSTSTQTTLSELSYAINTQGSYTDLSSMLNPFNNSYRLTSLEDVVFSKQVDSPLIMSLTGKIYFYK